MTATVVLWLLMYIAATLGVSLYTYEARQDRWEREHPGATYIRGYKTALRKADKKRMREMKKRGVL